MRAVTTTTVNPRSRKAPVRYLVAGVYGLNAQSFTDREEATAYAMRLAYGTRREYKLAG